MIAPSISSYCDADSGAHWCVRFGSTALASFALTLNPRSNSFSVPGGSGARHRGHVSDTPSARSSDTHPV
eukprot:CAMPEP_0205943052 /NCGR_PEP_ID=MMETSP1325-20131115/59366_1 /ASSEMBLY_ACC=CAM_ASM_000708 /TAXON_ID=236786 /ORGANISM="Florenciella sp., Strain RCC1007" /LENGTH=69 /DNA_ID=CAMNT_0053313831 /DNA_START=57 /DNA_END=262 /DNA_ORIENTATION=-